MKYIREVFVLLPVLLLCGCYPHLPLLEHAPMAQAAEIEYRVGPGDMVQVFVWRNPEFSVTVPVRPDGKISIPLVEDVHAANQTPTELAKSLELALAEYINDPVVTVMVSQFSGVYEDNVRVVGEAAQPKAIPYRAGMSILDVMIMVGGLTPFADGNHATLTRTVNHRVISYRVRLDDLLKNGDIRANALVMPGDVLIIPEAFF